MAPQPTVPTCPVSRAGRLRAFFVLIGLVALCLLAFRSPAFAEEAQPDPSDDAPTPRAAMDVTDKVSVDGVKLQKKSGDSWLDIPAGTTLTSGAYVRIYIDWSIPDMTDVHAGDTFTFTVNGDDHFLASDFGPVNLVDPTTQKVIGSYVVNGNRDANGSMIPGQDITIVTTLSDDGAQFPSLHNGFFSLEGYVTGQGNDIVFTVNGQALPSIGVEPPTTGPLPDTPLMKYGSQVAGQNQIVWSIGVNLDNIVDAYANYAVGGSDPSPQQRNLLLTDDLQGGQAITSGGVTVYMPVVATTDAGEAQTEQYAAYPITDLFALTDKSAADGMTQDEFASSVRMAAVPTIGVWEGHVVYIGFGDVPTGDGSSALNMGKILDGRGDEALAALLTQNNVTTAQRDIITDYLATTGSNKGDFTSFIIEMRTDASETGQYQNTATLTYGDSSSETASGGAHFTVISGGVEVRDGKVVLTKVDADDATTVLAGAVFKLEQRLSDGRGPWSTASTRLPRTMRESSRCMICRWEATASWRRPPPKATCWTRRRLSSEWKWASPSRSNSLWRTLRCRPTRLTRWIPTIPPTRPTRRNPSTLPRRALRRPRNRRLRMPRARRSLHRRSPAPATLFRSPFWARWARLR